MPDRPVGDKVTPLRHAVRVRPLPPLSHFLARLARAVAIFVVLVGGSLAIGAWGFHRFEKLHWLDATLNAAMLLTGMGPLSSPETRGGKLFAIGYALFSGVVFLSGIAVLISPLARRLLHRFHLYLFEGEEAEGP